MGRMVPMTVLQRCAEANALASEQALQLHALTQTCRQTRTEFWPIYMSQIPFKSDIGTSSKTSSPSLPVQTPNLRT
jgi:hypothetical protein